MWKCLLDFEPSERDVSPGLSASTASVRARSRWADRLLDRSTVASTPPSRRPAPCSVHVGRNATVAVRAALIDPTASRGSGPGSTVRSSVTAIGYFKSRLRRGDDRDRPRGGVAVCSDTDGTVSPSGRACTTSRRGPGRNGPWPRLSARLDGGETLTRLANRSGQSSAEPLTRPVWLGSARDSASSTCTTGFERPGAWVGTPGWRRTRLGDFLPAPDLGLRPGTWWPTWTRLRPCRPLASEPVGRSNAVAPSGGKDSTTPSPALRNARPRD